MLNNFVEQMIQRQAQMLASTSIGQSVAVSA
jgi:mannitol/fructose-specific phosphotransferase system IIA component